MAEIVNLRQARKARKRQDEAQRAEENRKRFGRTKSEKTLQSREAQRAEALLDGAKREVPSIVGAPTPSGGMRDERHEDDADNGPATS
ncbi:DUF4169 family protein [Jiella marina]|uniref:DUF4169 family protein n=1 Tax=Jiella sp. LLJ827 TaxID=2917712 RepID=UPI00350E4549